MNFFQTLGVLVTGVACAVLGWLVFETRTLIENVQHLDIKINKCNKMIRSHELPRVQIPQQEASSISSPALEPIFQNITQIRDELNLIKQQQINMNRSIMIQYVMQDRKDMALGFLSHMQGMDENMKARWMEALDTFPSWADLRQQALQKRHQDGTDLSPRLLERLGILVKKEGPHSIILDQLLDALNKQNFTLACSYRKQGLPDSIEDKLQKMCDLNQVLE